MFRNLLVLAIIVFITSGMSLVRTNEILSVNRQDQNDKILWSSCDKLDWNDFLGEPNNDKINVLAMTQCEIKIISSYRQSGIPKYIIACNFIKLKSWTTTNDSLTLNHEQIHFDIYEIYARKIRKEFQKLNLLKEDNVNKYNNIFVNLVNEAISENNLYDSEVYFNMDKQREWINKVAIELEKFKEYEYIPEE